MTNEKNAIEARFFNFMANRMFTPVPPAAVEPIPPYVEPEDIDDHPEHVLNQEESS
jgi:hypothetical protein